MMHALAPGGMCTTSRGPASDCTPPSCPLPPRAAACLNMALYPFTESSSCVCTAAGTRELADLADAASSSALWALYGAAGLCAGALFGAMEMWANTCLLPADQLFLKVMKRRSSRWVRVGRRMGEWVWQAGGHLG